ncbi:unnamed protein product [Cladocopium goreaui]|uniref:Transmembrane protein n=1 Tax=Cladocopium goreaui TaxID=2562237 RepID=A0A9P1G3R5_9DINO|nr:unnamed protein product [Cladocopium goreaui]
MVELVECRITKTPQVLPDRPGGAMDDADAALEKFFEEDALLEALQDAPDMEAQAEVFKVPKPSTAAPAAPAAEVTPVAGTSGTAALGSAARARRTEEAMSTLEIEKPGPATRAPVPRAKAGRSWTGTMLVVCISLSIWLLILWLWNGTDENELWPAPAPSHSQDWWRRAPAIRLPNNDTGAAAMDASVERVRVDTAWSSADVSGNATSNATANATSSGEGIGRRIRKGRRDPTGIGH